MATLTSNNLTMAELAKRFDPDGKVAPIVELLSQSNPIVDHAIAIQGNLPTGHRFVQRVALPTVGLRALNEGVQQSKSKTAQIDEAVALVQAYSDIDVDLAELNGNINQTRYTEDKAFVEAMNQKFVELLFYGDPANDPKEFRGLATRYNSTSAPGYGDNIVVDPNASGSNCMSLFFVTWDENATFLITPKGSAAGLQQNDKGEVPVEDSSGGIYYVYRTEFKWKFGLGVKDWRQNARIQVDRDAMFGTTSPNEVFDLIAEGFSKIHNRNMGRLYAYCSREFYLWLWKAAMRLTSNSTLARVDVENGRPLLRVFGVPVFEMDGVAATETVIS